MLDCSVVRGDAQASHHLKSDIWDAGIARLRVPMA
jgi:hypothetical protein